MKLPASSEPPGLPASPSPGLEAPLKIDMSSDSDHARRIALTKLHLDFFEGLKRVVPDKHNDIKDLSDIVTSTMLTLMKRHENSRNRGLRGTVSTSQDAPLPTSLGLTVLGHMNLGSYSNDTSQKIDIGLPNPDSVDQQCNGLQFSPPDTTTDKTEVIESQKVETSPPVTFKEPTPLTEAKKTEESTPPLRACSGCACCQDRKKMIDNRPKNLTTWEGASAQLYKEGTIVNLPVFEMLRDSTAECTQTPIGDVCAKCRYGLVVESHDTHMVIVLFGTCQGQGGSAPHVARTGKFDTRIGICKDGDTDYKNKFSFNPLVIPAHFRYCPTDGAHCDFMYTISVAYDTRVSRYGRLPLDQRRRLLALRRFKQIDQARRYLQDDTLSEFQDRYRQFGGDLLMEDQYWLEFDQREFRRSTRPPSIQAPPPLRLLDSNRSLKRKAEDVSPHSTPTYPRKFIRSNSDPDVANHVGRSLPHSSQTLGSQIHLERRNSRMFRLDSEYRGVEDKSSYRNSSRTRESREGFYGRNRADGNRNGEVEELQEFDEAIMSRSHGMRTEHRSRPPYHEARPNGLRDRSSHSENLHRTVSGRTQDHSDSRRDGHTSSNRDDRPRYVTSVSKDESNEEFPRLDGYY
ncbi:hypothetical protein K491DRAFT_721872 [Lophiostoma macrostomum CBS 122681]|uniref:Uncharacterized protein n=1 Tax=Lophiostoma macrostomum CBS 122681 TaxID=1314788 RepID=A0A6A6SS24_9PLEO|nr:hypothetical protein K491DRAFT_721872 [Lophiostoma macrostomum CBS 122681]